MMGPPAARRAAGRQLHLRKVHCHLSLRVQRLQWPQRLSQSLPQINLRPGGAKPRAGPGMCLGLHLLHLQRRQAPQGQTLTTVTLQSPRVSLSLQPLLQCPFGLCPDQALSVQCLPSSPLLSSPMMTLALSLKILTALTR